jgi:cytochrome c-type biogenesis protein CcsB
MEESKVNLFDLSSTLFLLAFGVYVVSAFSYGFAVTGRRWGSGAENHTEKWSRRAYRIAAFGVAFQLTGFILRWIYQGHIPMANLFEYISFLGLGIMIAFLIIYFIYPIPALGLFALPTGIIILAFASVFPTESQPLVPALQSNWLKIHVTTAALAEAFFAVGFAAALMYLLRTVDQSRSSNQTTWLELSLLVVIFLVGFIVTVFGFRALGYEAVYTQTIPTGQVQEVTYTIPAIFKPHQGEVIRAEPFFGNNFTGFEAPSLFKGANAGRKLNTVTWSVLVGLLIYGLLRLLLRERIGKVLSKVTQDLDPELVDEISYRAIAIGFPLFTLGALIFASIWAEKAWGRFWGWDPKEVWALVTWGFYAVYLHFRLVAGWQGRYSAWLAVLGFIVVIFTLIGVNLLIAGLHAYTGL